MSAVDFVQIMRECFVSALDTAPLVVAVTGRASGNLVAWDDIASETLPIAAYRITHTGRTGGLGDEREVRVTFRAAALTESQANELLGAIERSLTYPRLKAATPSVAAYRRYDGEQRVAAEYDPDVEAHVGDLDAVLVADNPLP